MPPPIVPPPSNDSGALTVPRQLQRWLDENPVTKLDRCGTFITLPAFSVNVNWQGYSDIVAAFTFEGTHNFTLKQIATVVPLSNTGPQPFSGTAIGAEGGGMLI